MKKTLAAVVVGLVLLFPASALASKGQSLDLVIRFLIASWLKDKSLSRIDPPQVLPISSGSRIYGACGARISGLELSGSGYCESTHSIYLVPEQVSQFVEVFGPSAQAYVVAHEFGHAIQVALGIKINGPARELQADCLAGILIDKGSTILKIKRDDVIDMATAAYAIGSSSHGSGAQRSYALLSGMGVFKGSCKSSEMTALANGENKDPAYLSLARNRSGQSHVDTGVTPYPKTVGTALGL